MIFYTIIEVYFLYPIEIEVKNKYNICKRIHYGEEVKLGIAYMLEEEANERSMEKNRG